MGSFHRLLEKYHMEKWFQRENLVVLVLAGILVVIIAMPIKEPEKEQKTAEVEEQTRLQPEETEGEYERSLILICLMLFHLCFNLFFKHIFICIKLY